MTFPLISTYHASKFAVEGLSESLSYELSPLGIRVKIVEPGMTATDFGGRSMVIADNGATFDYAALTETIAKHFASANSQSASDPSVVAEVIYQAATDPSNRLRYASGEDAKEAIAQKLGLGDESYVEMIRKAYGLN